MIRIVDKGRKAKNAKDSLEYTKTAIFGFT